VLDVEPPPPGLSEKSRQKFGFSMYSARYGNIYTVRQLLQLAQEVAGEWAPQNVVWQKDGKFFDALRPAIEPVGLDSPEEVIEQRRDHIARVRELFTELDLLIFTLGLTEMWVHKESGTVYPTAPGTIAGDYDDAVYEFKNADFVMIDQDFKNFIQIMRDFRKKNFRLILTVSPVPLTATASGNHVLVSTVQSKSILRAIAATWSQRPYIDYFPSYEIVTNPRLHSTSFADNLRSVRDEAVETVMRHFFSEHPAVEARTETSDTRNQATIAQEDVQCEEALMEAFAK
jgi:hypothetical protein